MSWIKNIVTVLFSIFIALVIAEISLRIFGFGYGNSPLERSHTYHHVHPSDYNFLMHDPNGEYGGYKVYYDNLGFRVLKESSRTKKFVNKKNALIFLGDSFTEGNQVPYHETFVSLIGKKLNLPSLNFGVSSYSPLLYELQAQKILSKFNAKVVILQIFRNDFENDQLYLKDAIFESNQIIGVDGGKNNVFITLARNSYLARFLRKSQLLLQTILSKSNNNVEKFSTAFDYEQNIKEEQLQNTVKIIKRIQTHLTIQGKKLYVFLIPSRFLSYNNQCCVNDTLYTRFYSALAKNEVETIDVKLGFEKLSNQNELFFMKDIHLTSLGHRVIADSLAAHLKAE